MLQTNRLRPMPDGGAQAPEFVSPAELYKALLGFVGRQYPVIAFGFVLVLALGAVYVFTSPPRYTGRAVIVIDTHKSELAQQGQQLGDLPMDSPEVDTQIEILKSENIATSVIRDLHLTEDPEFTAPYPGFVGRIFSLFGNLFSFGSSGHGDGSHENQLLRTAIGTLQSHMSVTRVGLTYAIDIEYQSLNPDRAAQVANAIADAYVVDALEAKYQTTRRAGSWLQDRLKELREQSSHAERAVNDFKQKNNIVDSGGSLLNEQQLAELNSSLVQAQAQTAEAKARLDRVSQILQSDDPDPSTGTVGTVTDTLHNDVITKLRQQYLDLAAKEADWSKRYGYNHLAVVNLRNQMREIRANIADELKRIAETYKSDYDIAKARQDSVQKSLNNQVAQSQEVNGAEVTLHDLESSAQTYRALYDNFLQRYMESVQQQSFPISDARLITPASRPVVKSAPRSTLVLALASFGGLMLGIGIGFLREISDRVFRTTSQVNEHLDSECLAVVPLVTGPAKQAPLTSPSQAAASMDRVISRESGLLRMVVDAPFSRFTESIRALKVAIDLSRVSKTNKVIAITSSLPNEGKSTIATTLAQIAAHSGSAVLLVDGDLRNPTLTRKLAPGAELGLLEVVSGTADLADVIWTDPSTGLSFLPTVVLSRLAHSSEILSSEVTKKLFEELRKVYDYIIVDMSPLAPVVDVRATTHLVDSFLFIIEWGRTKIDVAEHTLNVADGVYQNLLGVVLNKADMARLGRYESHRGNYYYNRYYARYGYTD